MKNSPVRLQESSWSQLQDIQFVATDMDGTLTHQGRFTPKLLQSLTTLAAAGVVTYIVTGRSAGWVQSVSHYLPVAGAIAENGGVWVATGTGHLTSLIDLPALDQHRHQLAEMFVQLQTWWPDLRPSVDNRFRLTDWTFDIGDLLPMDCQNIAAACQRAGWGFTYSTVQCHIRPMQQDKGVGLAHLLKTQFATLKRTQVVTVGDSLNDEELFDADQFPLSVGVANVQHYCDRLQHLPRFITHGAEVEGFYELVQAIASAKATAA
ncbi:MAG: HAD family hydrolase [Leptolyngbyaceae cyanobacterium]